MEMQSVSIKNLEMQMGQMANALAQFNRQPDYLPSNTEPNLRREEREHCNAITLRSGTVIQGAPQCNPMEERAEDVSSQMSVEQENSPHPIPIATHEEVPKQLAPKEVYPPPPFPQRLQKQKIDQQKPDQKLMKFLEVLKKLHINIPFVEALEQMPKYARFMKELLTHKRRLEDFKTVALTEECSAIVVKKSQHNPQLKILTYLFVMIHEGNKNRNSL